MNGLTDIVAWLGMHVKMHEKRRRTLARMVASAMTLRGMGVLALGRAMKTETSAKHAIKRVWRFLRNEKVECEAVQRALFEQFIPMEGPLIVLVDWAGPLRSIGPICIPLLSWSSRCRAMAGPCHF